MRGRHRPRSAPLRPRARRVPGLPEPSPGATGSGRVTSGPGTARKAHLARRTDPVIRRRGPSTRIRQVGAHRFKVDAWPIDKLRCRRNHSHGHRPSGTIEDGHRPSATIVAQPCTFEWRRCRHDSPILPDPATPPGIWRGLRAMAERRQTQRLTHHTDHLVWRPTSMRQRMIVESTIGSTGRRPSPAQSTVR